MSRGARIAVMVGALAAGASGAALPLAAQSAGAIAGRVRETLGHLPVAGATVVVDGRQGAVTDDSGAFRVREVRSGWHHVRVMRIGYRPVTFDSVLVRGGLTTTLDVALEAHAVGLDSVVVRAERDRVLDPLAPQDMQRITAQDIRRLPVTTVQEAVELSAGAVGESYRGGRIGESAFIIDGLGVKNQIDASTGQLGVAIPPAMLTEAALVTNAFSARYGQAISGMINVVTRDPGDHWSGSASYETSRPLPSGWDMGIDRAVLSVDGPVARGIGFVGVLDVDGRLDADPVNAPAPPSPLDPRAAAPWLLPHNSGERYTAAGKLLIPVDRRNVVRLFALGSLDQRLLFDPAYKYEPRFAPAQRLDGRLYSAHWQHTASPEARHPFTADVRLGWFDREFTRGALNGDPGYAFGGFTATGFHFLGEGLAQRQDTAAARTPLPGFAMPDSTADGPWGVPAFFLGGAPRGEIAWNRYRELRSQVDLTFAGGPSTDFYLGGEFSSQRVRTFQRVFAYLPVGTDSTPPAVASSYAPQSGALYGEVQTRVSDLALTFGLRYDQCDPRSSVVAERFGARRAISPRFAASTVLKGATFVASWGIFTQAPDFQYLTDAAFDDTLRTGRFRRGNPNLGFENASQFEFSVRMRPRPETAVRVNAYVKRLNGLVASVPVGVSPDSAIFGNSDFGTVKGAEVILDRDFGRWASARVAYTLQFATATSTNPYQILRQVRIDTLIGDTITPARVEFPLDYDRRHSLTLILQGRVPDSAGPRLAGARVLAGLEGAVIGRYASGLPYTRTNFTGDSLLGLPNSWRLPSTWSVDLLLRRPVRVGAWRGSVYLDMRNLFNTRNLESVRRDSGEPYETAGNLDSLARLAYAAHPEPIPYESPRYRSWADLNHDGLIAGPGELLPLYRAAAADFTQPIFAYGPPRLVRLGLEFDF